MISKIFLCIELLNKPDPKTDPSQDPLGTIGESGFWPIDSERKMGEMGVMLNSGEIRGKGYAVEALDMCFAYGFDNLGLETINLGTDRDNEPMKQLMVKKFELTPVFRENEKDWSFNADKAWWDQRQEGKSVKIVVDDTVEDWFEED